jgi:hypothetical protein
VDDRCRLFCFDLFSTISNFCIRPIRENIWGRAGSVRETSWGVLGLSGGVGGFRESIWVSPGRLRETSWGPLGLSGGLRETAWPFRALVLAQDDRPRLVRGGPGGHLGGSWAPSGGEEMVFFVGFTRVP